MGIIYASWLEHHLYNVNHHKFDPTLFNYPAMDMKGIVSEQTQQSYNPKTKGKEQTKKESHKKKENIKDK